MERLGLIDQESTAHTAPDTRRIRRADDGDPVDIMIEWDLTDTAFELIEVLRESID